MKFKLLLLCLFFAIMASVSAQTTVDLGAAYNATIFESATSNSDGEGPGIFVGTAGSGASEPPRRGLISFNLSSIPAGSTINSVQLTLTVGMIAGGGTSSTRNIGLFAVPQAWGDGATGAGVSTLGGNGNGFAAGAGDATWNDAAYNATPSNATPWTTAGGDYVLGTSTLSASASISYNSGNPPQNNVGVWSSAQMVSDVQGWLNNSATNFGWELINSDETDPTTFDEFYSSEGTNVSGVISSELPVLQVTYTVPEPASGSLMAFASLTVLSLHRLRRRA